MSDACLDCLQPLDAAPYGGQRHERWEDCVRLARARLAACERVVEASRRLAAAADACDREAERHPSSRSSAPVVRSIKAMNDMRAALAALDGKEAEQ